MRDDWGIPSWMLGSLNFHHHYHHGWLHDIWIGTWHEHYTSESKRPLLARTVTQDLLQMKCDSIIISEPLFRKWAARDRYSVSDSYSRNIQFESQPACRIHPHFSVTCLIISGQIRLSINRLIIWDRAWQRLPDSSFKTVTLYLTQHKKFQYFV